MTDAGHWIRDDDGWQGNVVLLVALVVFGPFVTAEFR